MNINNASKCINPKKSNYWLLKFASNSTCPLSKVRAPSENYRVEQQIRAGGNADVGTETSRTIYTGVEMEVVRVNDVGGDHTSDRLSRKRRKTVWRRLAKSMAKVA